MKVELLKTAKKSKFQRHQNQILRLSTALTEVDTKGIRPYTAANLLTHAVLLSVWPPKLLIPVDPISNILPVTKNNIIDQVNIRIVYKGAMCQHLSLKIMSALFNFVLAMNELSQHKTN